MADKLIRNPQNGRMFSKFESMSKRANLAVQQHGLTREEKALLETKATVGHDSEAVQGYLLPMTQLIEDWKGNVGELRKIIALINEMNQMAQTHDPSLSAAEKRRVDSYAKELITFINRKTSLFLRAARGLQNVARKRKDAVVEHMSSSPSAVFRSIGRVLSTKDRADKNMLQARASIFKHVLGQQKGISGVKPSAKARKGSTSDPMRPWQADVDRPPQPDALGPVKSKRKRSDDSVELSSTLDELLVVNRAMLHQATVTNQLLRTNGEFAVQNQEAQERALGDSSVKLLPGSTGVGKKQKGQKSSGGGLFDTLFGGLRSAVGDLTKMIIGPFGLLAGFKLFKGGLGSLLGSIVNAIPKGLPEGANLASRTLGGIAKGLLVDAGVHGLGSLITAAEPDALKGTGQAVSGMGHAAGVGATIGSIVPGIGTAAGATIGAGVGAYKELWDQRKDISSLSVDSVAKGFTPKRTEVRSQLAGMTVSNAGLDAIKQRESFSAKPYQDQTGMAIGYGSHTFNGESVDAIVKRNPNFTVTKEQASANLRQRLDKEFVPSVRRSLKRPVSQAEFDSLVSVAYNRGVGAYTSSTGFLNKVNQGTVTSEDFKAAHGSKISGRTLQGVESRRESEFQQFSRGRDAKSLAALSNATRAGGSAPIVVAPQIAVAGVGGGGKSAPPVFVPTPMKPENHEDSLRMVRGVNGI